MKIEIDDTLMVPLHEALYIAHETEGFKIGSNYDKLTNELSHQIYQRGGFEEIGEQLRSSKLLRDLGWKSIMAIRKQKGPPPPLSSCKANKEKKGKQRNEKN